MATVTVSDSGQEMVTITKDEYDSLCEDRDWVQALEDAGVDNWSGIDYAQELLRGYEDDEE